MALPSHRCHLARFAFVRCSSSSELPPSVVVIGSRGSPSFPTCSVEGTFMLVRVRSLPSVSLVLSSLVFRSLLSAPVSSSGQHLRDQIPTHGTAIVAGFHRAARRMRGLGRSRGVGIAAKSPGQELGRCTGWRSLIARRSPTFETARGGTRGAATFDICRVAERAGANSF